ncbi:unnamed protein product, partial [Mesorhabditis belari]|uniref:C-type lectin domain-containing protein n=1 Tax=Mesorhabditis belari TaxID=2138241 RepID=A0AAF3ED34_9BILA
MKSFDDFWAIFSLVTIQTIFVESAISCPQNWQKYVKNEACYRVNAKKMTWAQAESDCIAQGGRLVGIVDEYENQFVYQLVRSANLSAGTVWLGRLSRSSRNAPFDWNDSTSSHFHSFRTLVESSSSQCISMWIDLGADGSWQPWECTYNGYPSVCKRSTLKQQTQTITSPTVRSHVSTRCCMSQCQLRCPQNEKCVPDDLNCLTNLCPNATGWCLPKN